MNSSNKMVKLLMIIVGVSLDAFSVAAFILPNHFLIGGVTGVGRVFVNYFGINISYVIFFFNILLLAISWWTLGTKFAMTIIFGTILFPTFLNIFQRFPAITHLTSDPVVAAIYGGAIGGIGIGLLVRAGASSGGSDVIPIILNRKFKLPVAPLLYLIDTSILLMQCPFASAQDVLMGILLTFIFSVILNKVVLVGSSDVQFMIISEKYKEINEALQKDLDVGTTLLNSETGHLGNKGQVIMCIVPNKSVHLVRETVGKVDEVAFITMVNVTDVRGRGFSLGKEWI